MFASLFQRKLTIKKNFFQRLKSTSASKPTHQGFDLMKWSKRLFIIGSAGIILSFSVGVYISTIYTRPLDFPGIERDQFLLQPLRNNFMLAIEQGEIEYRNKFIRSNLIMREGPETRLVKTVASRLINSSHIPRLRNVKWKITVLDQPNEMTAFCLENGSIYISSGVLLLAKNVEEIAFVLAHEIGHIVANHSFERCYYTTLNPFAKEPRKLRRIQEDEADYIGLMLCSRACYDPNKAIYYFETSSARAGIHKIYDQSPHCAFDHHHPEIRTENLKRLLPLAYKEMKQYECPGKFE